MLFWFVYGIFVSVVFLITINCCHVEKMHAISPGAITGMTKYSFLAAFIYLEFSEEAEMLSLNKYTCCSLKFIISLLGEI